MDELTAQVRDEVAAIVSVLERLTGRLSRWTGTVVSSDGPSARGRLSWSGHILIDRELAEQEARWRTEMHEALHTLSVGLTPQSYATVRGWEEGVVEELQRLWRPRILANLGVRVPESRFLATEADHRYNHNRHTITLDDPRQVLGEEASEYDPVLLNVLLADRPSYVIGKGSGLRGQALTEFQRRFANAVAALRGAAMNRFEQNREQLWQSLDMLMQEKSLPATREARRMLRDRMLIHPEDVVSADAGEGLAMMEEALEIIAAEEAAKSEPLVTGRSG